jgi:hypothetical protein
MITESVAETGVRKIRNEYENFHYKVPLGVVL